MVIIKEVFVEKVTTTVISLSEVDLEDMLKEKYKEKGSRDTIVEVKWDVSSYGLVQGVKVISTVTSSQKMV